MFRHFNFSLIHLFIGFYGFLGFMDLSVPTAVNHESVNEENTTWNLIKDKKDLKVYTRKSSDSNFKEVRIKASFNSTLENFIGVLNDVDNYCDWVYKCKTSYKLHSLNDNEYIYYTETNMPSVISNRDLLLHSKSWVDHNTGTAYTESVAKPDYHPIQEGIVRIEDYKSKWKISSPQKNIVNVDYTVKLNPGGSLPAWLVNFGISKGPVETMSGLKRVVEQ